MHREKGRTNSCVALFPMQDNRNAWLFEHHHRLWFAETPSFKAGRKQTVFLSHILMI